MRHLFSLFVQSFKNHRFGQLISPQTFWQALWYWVRFLLLFITIPVFLVFGAAVYFLPQLPSLLQKNLPDSTISIRQGKLSTTFPQPSQWVTDDFTLIYNHQASPAAISSTGNAALITQTSLYVKNNGQVQQIKFSDVPDFTVNRTDLVRWVRDHQLQLIFGFFLLTLLFTFIGLFFYFFIALFQFLLVGLGIWLLGKIMHRRITFSASVNFAVYAAVPALLINFLGSFILPGFHNLLSWIVSLILVYRWLDHYSDTDSPPSAIPSEIKPE